MEKLKHKHLANRPSGSILPSNMDYGCSRPNWMPFFLVSICIGGALLLLGSSGIASPRTWTNQQGQEMTATLIGVDGAVVTVLRDDGRLFDIPAARLSAADRAYAREWLEKNDGAIGTISVASREWPARVRVRAPQAEVVEEGGEVNIYRTDHFEFRCAERFSRDLVRRFGTIFEATYAAVAALPLGLHPRPREGGYWVVMLYPDRDAFIEAGGNENYGAQYDRSSGRVMVPMERLGVRRTSSGFSYSSTGDNRVLVHEVTHQVMHEWLVAGLPPWLVEGMACYMDSIPYSGGTFHFGRQDIGEYLATYRARWFDPPWPLVSSKTLLNLPRREWNQTVRDDRERARMNYYSATLLAHFFLHFDGEGDSRRLTRYFQALRAGAPLEQCRDLLLGDRTCEALDREVIRAFNGRGVRIVAEE